jgi:hypothetical protein
MQDVSSRFLSNSGCSAGDFLQATIYDLQVGLLGHAHVDVQPHCLVAVDQFSVFEKQTLEIRTMTAIFSYRANVVERIFISTLLPPGLPTMIPVTDLDRPAREADKCATEVGVIFIIANRYRRTKSRL